MGLIYPGIPQGLVAAIQATRPVKCLIETGTNRGNTAAWAAGLFERVITIEKSEVYFRQARVRLAGYPQVEVRHGDSREALAQLMPELDESCLIWLDSHWCGKASAGEDDQCPVLGELQALRKARAPHLILIDDARLILSPPPAPYQPSDWPGIADICTAIHAIRETDQVLVWRDIIVGMPESFTRPVLDYLFAENTAEEQSRQELWLHPVRAMFRRTWSRVTRRQ